MSLIQNTPGDTAADKRLAREARSRLNELQKSMLLVYANLMNYQHNNAAGVTAAQYEKALGADATDYKYVLASMKRLLLKMNPDLKAQLNEIVPKKPDKAATAAAK